MELPLVNDTTVHVDQITTIAGVRRNQGITFGRHLRTMKRETGKTIDGPTHMSFPLVMEVAARVKHAHWLTAGRINRIEMLRRRIPAIVDVGCPALPRSASGRFSRAG